mmetsp:Transcript_52931/g.133113  ORF Transcript_52931/g.133113 Transcript_52931/m.133113 type:complete len:277 (+) Transcript_52931:312-1142(+)
MQNHMSMPAGHTKDAKAQVFVSFFGHGGPGPGCQEHSQPRGSGLQVGQAACGQAVRRGRRLAILGRPKKCGGTEGAQEERGGRRRAARAGARRHAGHHNRAAGPHATARKRQRSPERGIQHSLRERGAAHAPHHAWVRRVRIRANHTAQRGKLVRGRQRQPHVHAGGVGVHKFEAARVGQQVGESASAAQQGGRARAHAPTAPPASHLDLHQVTQHTVAAWALGAEEGEGDAAVAHLRHARKAERGAQLQTHGLQPENVQRVPSPAQRGYALPTVL